jgi:hypothetical protein
MPPYRPVSPIDAAVVKSRNRAAAVAVIVALLAWVAAALGIWLIVASHAWTDGCLVNKPVRGAGTLFVVLGGLLSVVAGVAALMSFFRPRARGSYLALGVAAMLMGALSLAVCLVLFSAEITPHAINPVYLHPC